MSSHLFIRPHVHVLADPRSYCWSAIRCCVVVYMSRLPLLPLSDRVPFVVVSAALVALGGKDVMVTKVLIEDASMLMI